MAKEHLQLFVRLFLDHRALGSPLACDQLRRPLPHCVESLSIYRKSKFGDLGKSVRELNEFSNKCLEEFVVSSAVWDGLVTD